MQHEDTLMIKTYHGEHSCARVYENSTVKTPYLTNKFVDQIKLNPNISTETLAQTMAAGVKARVSFQQAYRTKKAALKRVERSMKEQYARLLAAVGLDPNNTTYIVAYATVEMESKDSWDWFMRILVNDLDIRGEGNGYTIISDKQKGLLLACEAVLPLAEHRFCVRQLWTNFNKLFPGKVMKDQLWAIAKSTTMAYYWKEMVLMKQMDPGAYDWLTNPRRPPKHWCKAHFDTVLKCDVLLNNLCESFNAFILPARSKPVISCFEDIRVKMMKRIAMRKQKMSRIVDPICLKPREILDKNKVKSTTDCIPYGTSSQQIEVESIGGSKYVVDLSRRTCACRRWDLTGIPCKHAISAINFMRQKPEDYVDASYQTSTYMAIYSNTVKPVNGMDLWLPSDEPAILPPQYNRQPGRPRTKRIKDASEKETDGPKLGRVQKSLKCSNCGILVHNMKTCHRHLPPKTTATKGTKKRKLNNGDASTTQPQPKRSKRPLKSKNELRSKAKQKAVEQKKKYNEKKAAARASTARPTATKGRPPRAPSSKGKDAFAQTSQVSSRSSVRIRENAKSRGK
ncbi:uncharacterized protein LOC121052774 [Rosa chinensis]|uniref:uncharacterized protein LOC121052774 n=1 Tax=Rosa chinensis TaxID=74649 RepID=UPI001AD8B3DE|nr:uncharacterized protein LOC121052774 [Rosa chinensis]